MDNIELLREAETRLVKAIQDHIELLTNITNMHNNVVNAFRAVMLDRISIYENSKKLKDIKLEIPKKYIDAIERLSKKNHYSQGMKEKLKNDIQG